LATGGLRTSLVRSGQQWDWPNGWAPLQWIAVAGLNRYGHEDLGREIAHRWIRTVETTFVETGLLFEKYDIENPSVGRGGEYATQVGFGWTNGVTSDFIDRYTAS
ncbi:MAG: trehalase family glycosidase, partial [Tsuneonella sp.]